MNMQLHQARPNRAVDRLLLIDAVKRLETIHSLDDYTLYGMGGPYLDDFRTFYEHFENLRMISFEKDDEVCKRQRFHLPFRNLNIYDIDLFEYLHGDDWLVDKGIFWIEYNDLELTNFEYFEMILKRAAMHSVVKITSKADPRDYASCERCLAVGCSCGDQDVILQEFNAKFGSLMPNSSVNPSSRPGRFAQFVQNMWKNAAQRALSEQPGIVFQPLSSFYYADTAQVLSLTGILCTTADTENYRAQFHNWQFSNLYWSEPRKIEIPLLSTKEQLKLEPMLPCYSPVGETLSNELGYLVAQSESIALKQLESYATFHSYYKSFVKGIP